MDWFKQFFCKTDCEQKYNCEHKYNCEQKDNCELKDNYDQKSEINEVKTTSMFTAQSDNHSEFKKIQSDKEVEKLIQLQLILLLHAYNCKTEWGCNFLLCSTMKITLNHLSSCQLITMCPQSLCKSSRRISIHWQYCIKENCPICLPVKEVVEKKSFFIEQTISSLIVDFKKEDGENTENKEDILSDLLKRLRLNSNVEVLNGELSIKNEIKQEPDYMDLYTYDDDFNLNFEDTFPTNLESIKEESDDRSNINTNTSLNPNESLIKEEIDDDTLSNVDLDINNLLSDIKLVKLNEIEAIPMELTKEWHQGMTTDIRNYLINMLIFSRVNFQEHLDDKMNRFIGYARRLESYLYEVCNSRSEYHNRLAEKISQIQNQLEV